MHERIQFLYESGGVNRELPFVVGVLADLSGQRDDVPPFAQRKFTAVDRDNLPQFMSRVEPRLRLTLPVLGEVTLRFRAMDDFEPAGIAAQVPLLADMLRARRLLTGFSGSSAELQTTLAELARRGDAMRRIAGQVAAAPKEPPPTAVPTEGAALLEQILGGPIPGAPARRDDDPLTQLLRDAVAKGPTISRDVETTVSAWLAAIDQSLSTELRSLLQHPVFRSLEATWRGLAYLVGHSDTGEHLQIRVLNARREELRRDLAGGIDSSSLYRRLYVEPYEDAVVEPFGLLVGDFEIQPADIDWLQPLARLAQASHFPFVAGASPALAGVRGFDELTEYVHPGRDMVEAAPADWRRFRDTPEAGFVALTVPRVLARLPYGASTGAVEEFPFEECLPADPQCLWMNAAWCYAQVVGAAFVRDGWFLRTAGFEGGGRLDEIASFSVPVDDEARLVGPVETPLVGPAVERLTHLGFVPVMAVPNQAVAAFALPGSCQRLPADATDGERVLGDLRYFLCARRVAQYLLLMAKSAPPPVRSAAELQKFLNAWLGRYVEHGRDEVDEETYLLLDAHVGVQALETPGAYRLVVALILPTAMETSPQLIFDIGTVQLG